MPVSRFEGVEVVDVDEVDVVGKANEGNDTSGCCCLCVRALIRAIVQKLVSLIAPSIRCCQYRYNTFFHAVSVKPHDSER